MKNNFFKIFFAIFFFYFISLFQKNFFVPFDLLFVILFLWSLKEKNENLAFFFALLGGFFEDLFSENPLGKSSFAFLILVFLGRKFLKSFQKEKEIFLILSLILATFFLKILSLFLNFLISGTKFELKNFQFDLDFIFTLFFNIIFGGALILLIKFLPKYAFEKKKS